MSENAHSIAGQIKARLGSRSPRIAVILGSGLGGLADEIENPLSIDYVSIKGFPVSTVAGHRGRLIAGTLSGKEVLCMQGRIHLYEGYPPAAVADIVKAFKLLGIETLIVTNAAGSLRKEMAPGSLMLIEDHLNLSGFNPLIGPNDDSFGPRFPNMNNVYTPAYRSLAQKIAEDAGITLHAGVYCMLSGPAFETPAEVRACRVLGADANGMSTVPETMTAAWCGIKVLGISALTNYCTGIEGGSPSHAETLENAAKASAGLTLLVKRFIGEL
ncbi:MAG: purine-nucleoside phosphorylase [Alphaproteobacteria bacterium]|nr:purine-nucleoside phosphorylase [Alphaproteobacteria bacterium]